jgi:hypothetical protein
MRFRSRGVLLVWGRLGRLRHRHRQRAVVQVVRRGLVGMGVPGGTCTSGPSAVSWGPNRIDVFMRGTDSALWHKWFDGGWFGWESLGGILTSAPAVCSWAAGRLDVFVLGTDSALWHQWHEGGWSGWESLGGLLTSTPAAASWDTNRIDVIARGVDSGPWHKRWDGSWSEFEPRGGVLISAPALSSRASGRLDLFGRGIDNALWHRPFDGQWHGRRSLGASSGRRRQPRPGMRTASTCLGWERTVRCGTERTLAEHRLVSGCCPRCAILTLIGLPDRGSAVSFNRDIGGEGSKSDIRLPASDTAVSGS